MGCDSYWDDNSPEQDHINTHGNLMNEANRDFYAKTGGSSKCCYCGIDLGWPEPKRSEIRRVYLRQKRLDKIEENKRLIARLEAQNSYLVSLSPDSLEDVIDVL